MEAPTPQQLLDQGIAAYKASQYQQAAASFSQAARAFQSGGRATDAAEARNNASVAFLKAGDAASALQSVEGTDQIFAEINDLRRQGMAVANHAAALTDLNRLEEALSRYTLAADLLKRSGEKDLRADVLKSISVLQLRTGKQLQALASMDSALDGNKHLTVQEHLLQKLLRISLDMIRRR